MKKVKNFLRKKWVRVSAMCCALSGALVVGASAAEGDPSAVTTAMTTGLTSVAADATSIIVVIIPIAVGVAGTIFVVRKAMSWFKSLAK